ncbi:MAG: hypothetical protein HYX78_04520 [Armatimonadetes bacterium]|nr:hypothetical protein [Armatimonadota bacterium]
MKNSRAGWSVAKQTFAQVAFAGGYKNKNTSCGPFLYPPSAMTSTIVPLLPVAAAIANPKIIIDERLPDRAARKGELLMLGWKVFKRSILTESGVCTNLSFAQIEIIETIALTIRPPLKYWRLMTFWSRCAIEVGYGLGRVIRSWAIKRLAFKSAATLMIWKG